VDITASLLAAQILPVIAVVFGVRQEVADVERSLPFAAGVVNIADHHKV
jgi:hypothetical protein